MIDVTWWIVIHGTHALWLQSRDLTCPQRSSNWYIGIHQCHNSPYAVDPQRTQCSTEHTLQDRPLFCTIIWLACVTGLTLSRQRRRWSNCQSAERVATHHHGPSSQDLDDPGEHFFGRLPYRQIWRGSCWRAMQKRQPSWWEQSRWRRASWELGAVKVCTFVYEGCIDVHIWYEALLMNWCVQVLDDDYFDGVR